MPRTALSLVACLIAPPLNRPTCPLALCRPHNLQDLTDGSLAALTGSWEQRRHWYAPAAHRLLQQHVAARGTSRFESSLAHSQHAYLWQHIVSGRSILPGAAMVEAPYAAVAVLLPEEQLGSASLQGAAIAAPLLLKQPFASSDSLVLHMAVQHATGAVQLSSRPADGGRRGQPTLHLTAVAAAAVAFAAQAKALSPSSLAAVARVHLSQKPQSGLAWSGDAVGSVCQQPPQQQLDSYHCHPAAVDASTHFGAAFDLSLGAAPRVPVALGRYSAGSPASSTGGQQLAAFASAGAVQQDGSRVSSFGITASNASLACLAQLQSRPIGAMPAAAAAPTTQLSDVAKRLAADCCTYQTMWQAAQPLLAAQGKASNGSAALRLESSDQQAAVAKLPASLPAAALGSYAATLRMLHSLRPGKPQQLTAKTAAAGAQAGAPLLAAGTRASLAAAALAAVSGLLKVAALEEPAWQLSLQLTDMVQLLPARLLLHHACSLRPRRRAVLPAQRQCPLAVT